MSPESITHRVMELAEMSSLCVELEAVGVAVATGINASRSPSNVEGR